MSEDLCISTYAKYLRSGIGRSSDEDTYDKLFTWAIHRWEVDGQRGELHIDKTEASKLASRKKDVNSELKAILLTPENYKFIKEHFKKTIVPMMGTDEYSTYHQLYKLAERDSNVSDVDKIRFNKLYENITDKDNKVEFLAYMFVIAVGRPNTIPQWTSEDMTYLMEVKGICPLCGKPMKYAFNQRNGCNFKIIHIYPKKPADELDLYDIPREFDDVPCPTNPEDSSNKIAVHRKCGASYEEEPDIASYKILRVAKDNIVRSKNELNVLEILRDNAKVLEKLDCVIRNLRTLKIEIDKSIIPKMKPIDVEDKIKPEYSVLAAEIREAVVLYREKIWQMLLMYEKEGILKSKTIMARMASAYSELRDSDIPQPQIFNAMAKWIADSLQVGDDYLPTCRLIVSFFVQNCEVFDVITE